jgi:hypothetical protein
MNCILYELKVHTRFDNVTLGHVQNDITFVEVFKGDLCAS